MFLHFTDFLSYQFATRRLKMTNQQAEVENEVQKKFFNTRSLNLGLFSVPKTQKFCSEDNFFARATRCANELLMLNVIEIDLPLGIFRTKVHNILVEKRTHFSIDFSCSHFVKRFCRKCRS